jgi:hypothetical protein
LLYACGAHNVFPSSLRSGEIAPPGKLKRAVNYESHTEVDTSILTIFRQVARPGQVSCSWTNAKANGAATRRPSSNWSTNCLHHPEENLNMPLINLIVPLVVVGVVLWLINSFIPMASSIKTILNVVVVVCVGVWVLQATGLWGNVSTYRLHMR